MTQPPNQQPSPSAAPEPAAAAGAVPSSAGQAEPAPTQPITPITPSYIPPTVAAAVSRPAKKGPSAGSLAFVAAIVIASAGLGFAGGRLSAPQATAGRGTFNGNVPGANGAGPDASGNPARAGFGGFGGGSISLIGQVTAVADGSITIQTANGQSVTLQVPSTATYHTQAAGSASSVTVGSNVQVSVSRPNFRPDASGQPAGNAPGNGNAPGAGNGQGNGNGPAAGDRFNLTVTDITILAK